MTSDPAHPTERATKIGRVIAMLSTAAGADARALADATGWQLHTVRGAIAGQIKKKLQLNVTAERIDGRTFYRIV